MEKLHLKRVSEYIGAIWFVPTIQYKAIEPLLLILFMLVRIANSDMYRSIIQFISKHCEGHCIYIYYLIYFEYINPDQVFGPNDIM